MKDVLKFWDNLSLKVEAWLVFSIAIDENIMKPFDSEMLQYIVEKMWEKITK